MKALHPALLPATVFLTGASVLIIEVVAVRVLSPYYGNTIFTVSSVISVILAALSIGYYAGGRFADRHPSLQWFFSIILWSGIGVLLFHAVGSVALPLLSRTLSISLGPLVSSLLLFLFPAVLLGTLSPYAVKLQSAFFPQQGIGTIAGRMFFWSTLGSIAGSLLAGFVLIPKFGVDQILIADGIVLAVLGLLPLIFLGGRRRPVVVALAALGLVLGAVWVTAEQTEAQVRYQQDGVYEKLTISDGTYRGRPTRFLLQDRSHSGATFLDTEDPKDLVFDYTKYYTLYKLFVPRVRNALAIGGGAYSVPKALLVELPDATIDVAEIEPSLYDLAKTYFHVPESPRLQNIVEDGRRFLRHAEKTYDVMFSDVYYSLYSIPAHFTSREFFALARDRLTPDGVFIANIIGDLSRQRPSLVLSEMKTFRSVFPNSYFFAAESPAQTTTQNILFVGSKSDRRVNMDDSSLAAHADPLIRSLPEKRIDPRRFELSPYPLLTDTYAPVEYLTGSVLQRSARVQTPLEGAEMLALIAQQLRYGPRYLSARGHTEVQEFLRAEMEILADVVRIQTWTHTGSDGAPYTLRNIVGRFSPSLERRVVLGTHYDSKKFADKDPQHGDMSVPGANDSSSGVAVLVEVARVLAASPTRANVGVDIVFFDGEEGEEHLSGDYTRWKPLGSTYFAEHLNELYEGTKPVGGIVLDMVCDRDLQIDREQASVRHAPAQVAAFWKIAQQVSPTAFRDRVGQEISDDHTPLNAAGIPSVLVIDFEFPHHHTARDTLDTCSAESLETVARAVRDYVFTLP